MMGVRVKTEEVEISHLLFVDESIVSVRWDKQRS